LLDSLENSGAVGALQVGVKDVLVQDVCGVNSEVSVELLVGFRLSADCHLGRGLRGFGDNDFSLCGSVTLELGDVLICLGLDDSDLGPDAFGALDLNFGLLLLVVDLEIDQGGFSFGQQCDIENLEVDALNVVSFCIEDVINGFPQDFSRFGSLGPEHGVVRK